MIFKDSSSLDMLRDINKRIEERNFHEQTHLLYDIANTIDSDKIVYCEIGSYVGSSASLMLENKKVDKVVCIDPLNLDKSHFQGAKGQEQTLRANLSPYENSRYAIFKNYSSDVSVLEHFRQNNLEVDILFIDGDHSKRAVWKDFLNYKEFVKPGGFIIFDDYLDSKYSPEVKIAVDEIVSSKQTREEFDILGLPKCPALDRGYGIFIMRRA
jgi:predicted O-methyltransferase YrrM